MYLKCTSSLNILSQDWTYRGEGNANLVISLPNLRRIVRIRKTEKSKTFLELVIEWLLQLLARNSKQDINIEQRDFKFYSEIIAVLIGINFVSPVSIVTINKKDIQDLNILLKPLRPENRRNKVLQCGRASVFIDYALLPKQWDEVLTGPTFAFEIKPKQGWVPLHDRQFEKCPFCLNQYVKLKHNSIKEISGYCPLDLFSGNGCRMSRAIKCLIRNPQNNFKIFKDGNCFYNENSPLQKVYTIADEILEEQVVNIESKLDLLVEILCTILMKTYRNLKDCENCDTNFYEKKTIDKQNIEKYENSVTEKCNFSESHLPKYCILERILSLQKLDYVGLKQNHLLYQHLNSKEPLNNWDYIDKICRTVNLDKSKCPRCVLLQYEKKLIDFVQKNEEAFSGLDELCLIPYIIASIANDCSFMVTLRKIGNKDKCMEIIPHDFIFEFGTKTHLAINVGIFDLYPKPLSTIQKHKMRNERRCRAFLDSNSFYTH